MPKGTFRKIDGGEVSAAYRLPHAGGLVSPQLYRLIGIGPALDVRAARSGQR